MTRIPDTTVKRFKITREGITLAVIKSTSTHEAQRDAEQAYGPMARVVELGPDEPEVTAIEQMQNRTLMVVPSYKIATIEILDPNWECSKGSEQHEQLTMWLDNHLGICVVSYTLRTSESYSRPFTSYWEVLYYDLVEMPTVKTIDEVFDKLKRDMSEQIDFFYELLHTYTSNELLIAYAESLSCEINVLSDPVRTRYSVIQAIRRKKGWI